MVFVNDKKFACESCIKGHRSSNCQHTDRPLFEIKKKGRPVSQCQKCRELRKTKRMHSKCTCATSEAGPSSQALDAKPSAEDENTAKPKVRRFKPIAPALPNGIKDILPSVAGPSTSGSVNLCRCGGKEPSKCTCGHERSPPTTIASNGGLAALAQAAMFCCGNDSPSVPLLPVAPVVMTAHNPSSPVVLESDSTQKRSRGCCSSQPSSRPPSPKAKRSKHTPHTQSTSHDQSLLPFFPSPAQFVPDIHQPSSSFSSAPPAFPLIPPVNTLTSISYAAPECCCGTDCACPGCVKHRGEAHASADFEDCAEGSCGICVDNEGGIALPEAAFAASHGGLASSSSLASAPTSTSTSAPSLGAHSAQTPAPQKAGTSFIDAFGLVAVPKLECHCPGGCGCPEGRCACGDSCTGCGPGPGLDEGGEAGVGERVEASRTKAAAAGGCCG